MPILLILFFTMSCIAQPILPMGTVECNSFVQGIDFEGYQTWQLSSLAGYIDAEILCDNSDYCGHEILLTTMGWPNCMSRDSCVLATGQNRFSLWRPKGDYLIAVQTFGPFTLFVGCDALLPVGEDTTSEPDPDISEPAIILPQILTCTPNPCNEFTLLNLPTSQIISFKIYNVNGQDITHKISIPLATATPVLPFNQLPGGIYFIQIITENGDWYQSKIVHLK